MKTIHIQTAAREGMTDITAQVAQIARDSGVKEGVCVVYCPHTTAAIMINENADPAVKTDVEASLRDIVKDIGFTHAEGNSDSHVKSALLGKSQTLIVSDSALVLGTWDGIYFCEFDGPRSRIVQVQVIGE
jgi:secondary thiamine-phosphate synthase enzyme